jgi:YD repeat-containing protein
LGTHTHFSAFETLNVGYDSAGRRIRQSVVTGGTTHAVTQYSYNSVSLLECVAVRMNPAEFGSLPSSAWVTGDAHAFRNAFSRLGALTLLR